MARPHDAELARRIAQGDEDAFARLDDRYRVPLRRYARRLLRRSEHDADDVVQDVLIRAHAALRAGDEPAQLRPWLYRLARNRAIDEVRRARWGHDAVDDEAALLRDERAEPESVLSRREDLRALVGDLADLPVRQRTALLAREVDGLSPERVAGELGVAVPAAQMLVSRARDNLVKARAARDAAHEDIRAALLDAHERGVRPSEHVRRHLRDCPACRAYAGELKRLTRRLGALAPPAGLATLPLLGKLASGGGKAAVGAGAALAVAATGGVIVLATNVFSSGDPAPFQIKGVKPLVGHAVTTGQALPSDTALVTADVRLPAGAPPAGERRSVSLSCPSGMRVAGLQSPEQDLPLSYGLSKSTTIRHSRRATIVFSRNVLPRAYEATVGILCRRPGRTGSLSAHPRPLRPGETPAVVCARTSYIYESPGHLFTGTVFRDEPVAVQRRSASGRWTRIATDTGSVGWVRSSAIARKCP
jgi:RNA polymerase sigma factor (sigma-70 family)